MTPKRFEELLQQTQAEMTSIMLDKNKEYARSDDDRLMNFKRRGERLGLDPLSVLSIDLEKHIDGINSFIMRNRSNTHVLLNDPINRRILDAINYLFLLRCLIEDAAVNTGLTNTARNELLLHKANTIELSTPQLLVADAKSDSFSTTTHCSDPRGCRTRLACINAKCCLNNT